MNEREKEERKEIPRASRQRAPASKRETASGRSVERRVCSVSLGVETRATGEWEQTAGSVKWEVGEGRQSPLDSLTDGTRESSSLFLSALFCPWAAKGEERHQTASPFLVETKLRMHGAHATIDGC